MPKVHNKRNTLFNSCSIMSASIFIITFSVVFAFSVWFFNLLSERSSRIEDNCRMFDSQPIPEGIVQRLCANNLISPSLNSCDGSVISNEDVGIIIRSNVVEQISTYESVNEDFGDYELYCDSRSQYNPFRCRYVISTWGPEILIYYDNETELVQSIREVTCGGS